MHDPNAFADTVILMVKAALAPLQERIAALEARNAALVSAEKALADLRDRVVTVETKAATPVPLDAAFYELRERVMGLETKAVPAFEVPAEVSARLTALESRPLVTAVPDPVDLAPVLERVSKLEIKSAEIAPVLATVADVTKDMGAMRERIAVVEVRAQVPGPPGKDGANGKDGADGVGFDDLSVDFDGDRTLALKFERGTKTKTFPIRLPFMRQEGVYAEGKTYGLGDVVTWGGSQWHCNEETTGKPGESKAWTLIVKRGRDGRDGKDAAELPVVRVS